MAPPKTYKEANPTVVPFEEVKLQSNDAKGNVVVITDKRPAKGYEILTDDVLNSGNLELLYNFRTRHQKELKDPKYEPAKRYLDARIKTAEKLQILENKAKLLTAQNRTPPKPEVVASDGFIGFPNIRYPDYQTSANGCWSLAYSTLLKSRGIDLSQEEIRQWRPDYKENAGPNEKASTERKVLMNTDDANSIYTNADLVGKVLPNTAVNTLHLEPFAPDAVTLRGKALGAEAQKTFKEEYLAQVKEQLQTTLRQAIVEHQSPVALSLDGHFTTITAISDDGETVIYEESLGAKEGIPRTHTERLDALIERGMLPHRKYGEMEEGHGIELTWLSELPVKENGARQPALDPDGLVTVNRNGSVAVRKPAQDDSLLLAGSPANGQVSSKAVERSFVMDQTRLSKKLNGAKLSGIGADGGILLGSSIVSYPGRVMHPGDPKLSAEALASQGEVFSVLRAGLDYFGSNRATSAEKDRVSEFKRALRTLRTASGNQGEIDKARETLAGMYDFLLERPQAGQATRFETGWGDVSYEARADFVEKLRSLNDLLGLGKEQQWGRLEAIHEVRMPGPPQEERQPTAEEQYDQNLSELWKAARRNAAFRNVDGSQEQGDLHFNLALIAANHFAYQQNLRDQKNPPFPTEEQVAGYLMGVQSSEAFDRLVRGKMEWLDDETKSPTDFINDLNAVQRKLTEEKQAKEAEAQFANKIRALWNTVQSNARFRSAEGTPQQKELHESLALLAANYFAYQKNREEHKNPPIPTEEQVADCAKDIRNSETFRRLLKGKMEWLGDKTKSPMDFINDYNVAESKLMGEKRREAEEKAYKSHISELWGNVQKNAEFRSADGTPQQKELRDNLVLIAANYIAYGTNVKNHKDPPFPKDEEVLPFVEGVRKSETFDRILKGKMEWLGKSERPTEFLQEFYNVDKEITEEKAKRERELAPYKIPEETWKQRRLRLLRVAVVLRGTGTGSYTGLDVIARSKNSDDFDKAVEAITGTALPEKNPPAPEKVKTAVETVCAYLKGKEKKRTREFGRQRWTGCMRFLADTMPRAEFEKYCDHVNQVRGVKPGHPDYVSPETLYPPVVDLKYVTDDTISRIRSGQNTLRDYARIVAAQKNGAIRNSANPPSGTPINDKLKRQLCVKTQKLVKDPSFASFVKSADKQQLNRLLENGGAEFSRAWEGYQQRQLNAEQPAASRPQSHHASR